MSRFYKVVELGKRGDSSVKASSAEQARQRYARDCDLTEEEEAALLVMPEECN